MTNMPLNPQGSGFGGPMTSFKYRAPFEEIGALYGGMDKIPGSVKEKIASDIFSGYSDPDRPVNEAISAFLKQRAEADTPEGRAKILQQQLDFDRARGEQMQKYRMINDTIANLGQAARAAGGGYGLTPDYLGQSYANVCNAYLAGLHVMPKVAPQVGQKFF